MEGKHHVNICCSLRNMIYSRVTSSKRVRSQTLNSAATTHNRWNTIRSTAHVLLCSSDFKRWPNRMRFRLKGTLMSGMPNARVLCEPQNIAAMRSLSESCWDKFK